MTPCRTILRWSEWTETRKPGIPGRFGRSRALRVSGWLLGLALGLLGCDDATQPVPSGGQAGELEEIAGTHERKEEDMVVDKLEIPDPGGTAHLGGGEVHVRELDLAVNEFVRLVVRQQGVDVELRLWRDVAGNPAGEKAAEGDSPTGDEGPEELVAIASRAGRYRLEVAATGRPEAPSSYTVEIFERRTAAEDERRWVDAHEDFRAAWDQLSVGRYAEAITGLRTLLPVWEELGLRYRGALTRNQLGLALLRSGEPAAAIAEHERAADWFRALGERRKLANELVNAATAHLRLGETDRAVARLAEARPILEDVGSQRVLGVCLMRLGYSHARLGRPQEALRYLDRGLEIAREIGNSRLEVALLTDKGETLLTLHRAREAMAQYAAAVEIYRETVNNRGLETALGGAANAAVQLGDLEQAESMVSEALAALGPDGTARTRAALLITLGHIHRLRQEPDLDRARRAFEEAGKLAAAAGETQIEASGLLSLGYVEAECEGGEAGIRRGLELYERAFELYRDAGQASGLISSRARIARALRKLGRLEEAWEWLEPALADIENVRTATGRRDYRLAFFASFRQDFFETARDLLLDLHGKTGETRFLHQAFMIDDQRRGRELLDSLTFRGAEPGGEDPELLAEEEKLEGALRDVAGREPSPETSGETVRLMAELNALRSRLRDRSSAEALSPPVVDPDTLRHELLDDDTLLLVYSLGEERNLVWAVTQDALRFHDLDERRSLEKDAGKFLDLLQELRARSRQRLHGEVAPRLARRLLGPIADLLGRRRLAIVADGGLQKVPFAALPEPGPDGEGAFLIERHEIVYLPSVSALAALRRRGDDRREKQRRLAIFADPVFEADDPRVTPAKAPHAPSAAVTSGRSAVFQRSAAELFGGVPLKRLSESRNEGREILAFAGGEESGSFLVVDFEASRERFFAVPGDRYSILHLATHALLHPEPALSGFVLSQVDDQGRPRDGFVPAVEVSRLRLPLDLVVLSACQTGTGQPLRGEGILGLAWSFLDAGAARVIASLWKVGDPETAALMIRFYEAHLEEGLPPAAALRRAQLAMAEQPGAVPLDWAGFVIQGDWR